MEKRNKTLVITFNMDKFYPTLASIHEVMIVNDLASNEIADKIYDSHRKYLCNHTDVDFIGEMFPVAPKSDMIKMIISGNVQLIGNIQFEIMSNHDKVIDNILNLKEYDFMIKNGSSIHIKPALFGSAYTYATYYDGEKCNKNDKPAEYYYIGIDDDSWEYIDSNEVVAKYGFDWMDIYNTTDDKEYIQYWLSTRRPRLTALIALRKDLEYNYSQVTILCRNIRSVIATVQHDIRITHDEFSSMVSKAIQNTDILLSDCDTKDNHIILISNDKSDFIIGESELCDKYSARTSDGFQAQTMINCLNEYGMNKYLIHVCYSDRDCNIISPEVMIVGKLKRFIDSSEFDDVLNKISEGISLQILSETYYSNILDNVEKLFS